MKRTVTTAWVYVRETSSTGRRCVTISSDRLLLPRCSVLYIGEASENSTLSGWLARLVGASRLTLDTDALDWPAAGGRVDHD